MGQRLQHGRKILEQHLVLGAHQQQRLADEVQQIGYVLVPNGAERLYATLIGASRIEKLLVQRFQRVVGHSQQIDPVPVLFEMTAVALGRKHRFERRAERLPLLVGQVGHAHEHQACHLLRVFAGHLQADIRPRMMAKPVGRAKIQRLRGAGRPGGVVGHGRSARWVEGSAEARRVQSIHGMAAGQRQQQFVIHRRGGRRTMQQNQRRAVARHRAIMHLTLGQVQIGLLDDRHRGSYCTTLTRTLSGSKKINSVYTPALVYSLSSGFS